MKSLLIDVGNTSAKYAFYDGKEIVRVHFSEVQQSIEKITRVVCSKVATNPELDWILDELVLEPVFVKTSENAFGISNGYAKIDNLGVDRWLGVIGAESCFPDQNLIVVDAGTAMTLDAITADKQHLGGWIIPGLELMQSSIVEKAPGVFSGKDTELEPFGTDTPNALYSGCFYALIASIDKARDLFTKTTGYSDIKVVLTGGTAEELREGFGARVNVIPDLIFKGLARF